MNKWSMWKKFTEDNLEENPKEPGIYKIRICGESIYRFLGEDKNGEFWGRWLKKWKNWRSTLVLVDRSSPQHILQIINDAHIPQIIRNMPTATAEKIRLYKL